MSRDRDGQLPSRHLAGTDKWTGTVLHDVVIKSNAPAVSFGFARNSYLQPATAAENPKF